MNMLQLSQVAQPHPPNLWADQRYAVRSVPPSAVEVFDGGLSPISFGFMEKNLEAVTSHLTANSVSALSAQLFPRALSPALVDHLAESEGALRRFQTGESPERDHEWYQMVPQETRHILTDKEVQRQSVLFEIIKSERDYVRDLELIKEIFMRPLLETPPIPPKRLRHFVSEVFFHLDVLLEHHHRMLSALFTRQQKQHPLVQSIADIILDASAAFSPEYQKYIKHYKTAEEYHRAELKHNAQYRKFIEDCSRDPRTHRLDFMSFLHRPMDRLPRLKLLLTQALKRTDTDVEDSDHETLALAIDILNDTAQRSEHAMAEAETKQELWNYLDSLPYDAGENLRLDLFDEKRSLLYAGSLVRRYQVSPGGDHKWVKLYVALLDHHVLLHKPRLESDGRIKNIVISRPIPLQYLRISSSSGPAETRKDSPETAGLIDALETFNCFCASPLEPPPSPRLNSAEEGGLRRRVASRDRRLYPFTISHASSPKSRRYRLYARSKDDRTRWVGFLKEAVDNCRRRQEVDALFATRILGITTDRSGRMEMYKVVCAARFVVYQYHFIAVGRPSGVYILNYPFAQNQPPACIISVQHPKSLVALPEYDKLIIHADEGLVAYPLSTIALVAQGQIHPHELSASHEQISKKYANITVFRVMQIGEQTMITYTTQVQYGVDLRLLAVQHPISNRINAKRQRDGNAVTPWKWFRTFGEPIRLESDVHGLCTLDSFLGVCRTKGIYISDPLSADVSSKNMTIIPKFRHAMSDLTMQSLKSRCEAARPLGLAKCDNSYESMVVYDELGCYVDQNGMTSRSAHFTYVRWESKATAFVQRGTYLLLFSKDFVEVRTIGSGRLVQVMQGSDFRLLSDGMFPADNILAAMSTQDKDGGIEERLMDVIEVEGADGDLALKIL